MAIIYKLALENNKEIPERLREFFEKTSIMQDLSERAKKIDELIEEEFKSKIFPESVSKNYEIGFIAFIFLSLLYENLSLNLLQQFETYARYYWIHLKRKDIEDISLKIIDGQYELKKTNATESPVQTFNEKIVKEFSKNKVLNALELFSAIGELYIVVIEDFGREVKEKIEHLDSILKRTELEKIIIKKDKDKLSIKDKTISEKMTKSTIPLDQTIKQFVKIAFALAGIAGVVYLMYCVFHSHPASLKNDIISRLGYCLKRLLSL